MKPVILGLTGSIGMGKSTTARMFADEGIPVWDADEAVHRIYAPGGPGAAALAGIAPQAVTAGGGVDRSTLREALAEDPRLLERIEAAIHPLVAQDRKDFVERNAQADVVLLDIPLLFETGADHAVDRIVVVSTDAEEQRARVLSRPGMDEATFESLLARQLPDAEKRARAHHVVRTDDLETARRGVREILDEIRGPGAKDA